MKKKKFIIIGIIIIVALYNYINANSVKTVEPNGNGDYLTIGAALEDFITATDDWDIFVWYNNDGFTTYYEDKITWDASDYHIRLISTSDIEVHDFDYIVTNNLYDENRCIIDGNDNGRIFEFINSRQTQDDIIYGFKLQNANSENEGGALYYNRYENDNYYSGLTIKHCIFNNNSAYLSSAIYYNGNMRFSNNVIDRLCIENCEFRYNSATYTISETASEIAGIYDYNDGNITLIDAVGEQDNGWEDSKSSVCHIFGTSAEVDGCTFYNNYFFDCEFSDFIDIVRFGEDNYYTYGNFENMNFQGNNCLNPPSFYLDNIHLVQFDLRSPDYSYSNVHNINIGEEFAGDDNFVNNVTFFECERLQINNINIDYNGDFSNIRIRAPHENISLNNIKANQVKCVATSSLTNDIVELTNLNCKRGGFFNSVDLSNSTFAGGTPSVLVGDLFSNLTETVNINNVTIKESENGGLYYRLKASNEIELNIVRCLFHNNYAYGEYGTHDVKAGAINVITLPYEEDYNCTINIENSTFIDNSHSTNTYANGVWCSEDFNPENFTAINCIFWDDPGLFGTENLRFDWSGSEIASISYCDVNGGYDGIDNIDMNPLLIQEGNHLYHLLEGSPCIDAGDPDSDLDPDGTRADMGCYPTVYDVKKVEDSWNLVSFPRLERDGNDPVYAPDVLQNIEPFPTYLKLLGQGDGYLEYVFGNWDLTHGLSNVQSTSGYKLETSNEDNSYLPLSGTRLSPDTQIYLYADQENWIGYFLPYSQSPEDAFADIWDNITYIQADGWGMIRDGDEEWKGSRDDLSVDYGKLYIVGVERDMPFFTWNDGVNAREKYTKTETSVFSYEEESDYMMIFVDSTESIAGVDEIGVFLDDECIGASVVEEFPVFISAYIDDDSTQTKGGNELTFQTATYGKSLREEVPVYVYDKLMKDFFEKSVRLNAENYAFVRLGKGTGMSYPDEFIVYQNYPNPIRNTTTISFILPGVNKEADIKIYNIKGQLVKELGFRVSDGGFNAVWDCTDDNNKPVSSGIYFYKVTSGENSELKKMLLIR